MARLPFLVEHGDLVWKLLAVLAAAAAIALVRRSQARRERRATARELAARAEATTAPVEGVATVRGTLRGGSASSVSLLHLSGRRPYYDERAAELWLDCDGERVTLTGPVRVVRGTRLVSNRDRGAGLLDGERAVRSSPILHRLTAMTASVRDGDTVFVTARLTARPAADAMGYREAATAWTAVPHGDAIEVVAAQPAVRAMPLGSTRTVVTGLAGVAMAMTALRGLGAVALGWTAAPERATMGLVPVALGELDAVSLAAATPGNRDAALAQIEATLATRTIRTAESFALWRAIARERGGCGAEIRARIAQDDIAGLAPLAKHCKDDRAAVEAYQLLGLFQEAVARNAALAPEDQPIESLIAVRAWGRAAAWATARSEALLHRPTRLGVYDPTPETLRLAGALDCAAEWWSRIDEPGVDAWMARARYAQSEPACALFAALSRPEADQATRLANVAAPGSRVHQIANLLAWSQGASATLPGIVPTDGALYAAMFDAGDRMTVARALLSESAYRQRWRAAGEGLGETLTWRAVREMLRDNFAAARKLAPHLADRPRAGNACMADQGGTPCSQARALEIALALRSPTPRLPPGAERDLVMTDRILGQDASAISEGKTCDGPELGDVGRFGAAMLRARDGDGRDLATLLARCPVRHARVLEPVLAAWPSLHDGRDELAEVLRRFDLGPTPTDPLAVIGRAALRRDLARLIGDDSAANAWAAVAERHLAAFSDPVSLYGPSHAMSLTVLISRELVRDDDR